MFQHTHTDTHAPFKSFPGATAATLQIMAPMCVQGSKAVWGRGTGLRAQSENPVKITVNFSSFSAAVI